jgi:hypothetical protein
VYLEIELARYLIGLAGFLFGLAEYLMGLEGYLVRLAGYLTWKAMLVMSCTGGMIREQVHISTQ